MVGDEARASLRSDAWVLLGLLVLLIGYGSVFPFDYVPHEPSRRDLIRLCTEWPNRLSGSDVAGNMLLFIPLGISIAALARGWRPLLVGGCAAIFYAGLLQYAQFWFPSRVPSGSDVVFNAIGVIGGLACGVATRPLLLAWDRRHLDRAAPLWPVGPLLMLLWLVYRWFPWVPTLDPDNLRHALKPLLSPSGLPAEWLWPRLLHDAAGWLLWFWLARLGPVRTLVSSPRMLACAAAIVAAEPLFVGNTVSIANLGGLLLAAVVQPFVGSGRSGARALALLLALSILVSGLAPYHFGGHGHFMWLPFAGMLSGSMVVNTASLLEKCYLYGGLLALLAGSGLRWPVAALLVAAELAWIEWIQISLPGRSAEITDPLLALLLAFVFSKLRSRPQSPSGPQFMNISGSSA